MSLIDYINGHKKGKNAHDLEKASMKDPFLAEALEGFEATEGDHMAHILSIQSKIRQRKDKPVHRTKLWTSVVAAAVVTLIAVSASLLLLNEQEYDTFAENETMYPIDLYLPDKIYEENIVIIAQKNTELTKNISVIVSTNSSQKERSESNELDESADRINMQPIEILLPNGKKD